MQEGQVFSVNYQIMTAVLAKAIQEQQAMIDAIRAGTSADPIPLLADDQSFLDRIVRAFRELLGIEFGQGSVSVERLCVGSVCVTEEQFMQVFGMPSPTTTPAGDDGSDSGTSAPPTPSESVTPEPTPESTPESTPATSEVPPPPLPDAPAPDPGS
jgi:hypothetical protein